jgi:cytolethal distending toxin subunit A
MTFYLESEARAAGEVMLINVQTAKCLTIAGGVSTENNVEALQFDCDSDPSRR